MTNALEHWGTFFLFYFYSCVRMSAVYSGREYSRMLCDSQKCADGSRVPDEEVLAAVRLQEEFRDPLPRRGAAVEEDGRGDSLVCVSSAAGF